MNNFCGKRFLSSLLGALSVLSSPVASARNYKLGKGNLKGEVGSSARRDKNNGKLGELKSNRKVKSIGGLKKVLKETGGKVVGVSPDGKGGFVAFVETPAGIVTVTIVGVALSVIIGLAAHYVFRGRKNGGAKGAEKTNQSESEIESSDPNQGVGIHTKENQNEKKLNEEKPNEEIHEEVVENSADLFDKLFGDSKDKCDLFVEKLFENFFNDANEAFKKQFDECGKNLDEFLRVVFEESLFNGVLWSVAKFSGMSVISWTEISASMTTFGSIVGLGFFKVVLKYLGGKKIVKFLCGSASWGDKISAVLFAFWCSFKYNLGYDATEAEKILGAEENLNSLKSAFGVIRGYVRGRLDAAGKNYDGQKKNLDDDSGGNK